MRSRDAVGLGLSGILALLAACSNEASPPERPAPSAPPEAAAADDAPRGSTPAVDGGLPPACAVDADCMALGAATFCSAPACEAGTCIRKVLHPAGTPLPSQRFGDCREARCAEGGAIVDVPLDGDVFDDGYACTNDTCTGGLYSAAAQPQGSLCSASEICNAKGACVQCNVDVDCYGNETGTDCGGGACAPCAPDLPCHAHADCASNVCMDAFCIAPSCTDAVKNGDEAGVDCGGSCLTPCAK